MEPIGLLGERGAAFAATLVARQAEIGQLRRLVQALAGDGLTNDSAAPAAVVVQGPAGIGKTALWQAAVDEAARAGVRVLQARPAEAEATFAYAGLADLLRDALPDVLPTIPRQQRATLELALGVSESGAPSTEALDVSLVQGALTNALLAAASERPILVAVDDAPWLDGPSAAALQFLARRTGSRSIGFVVTQRVDEESPSPLGLDSAWPGRPALKLWLEEFSVGALHKLLEQRLGMTLPRAHLLRLHELSGGVPFHALEIARALQRGPLPPIGAPLPVPVSLRELLRQRLDRLPADARRLMLLIAAAGTLPRELADALLGSGAAASIAVADALDSAVLTNVAGQLRPAHPLIASTAYADARPSEVRQAHADLAGVVEEPEAVARHRALAIEGRDEGVAAALEAAGDRSRTRGAPETAAELLRLARDRTPKDSRDEWERRSLALAEALYAAADLAAAAEVLDPLLTDLPPSLRRARACMIRSEVAWYTETAHDAVAFASAGLDLAGDDAELAADLHYRLAIFHDYDVDASLSHARQAVALLEKQNRSSLLASALFTWFSTEVAAGRPPALDTFERALAVEPPDTRDATTTPGIWWLAMDQVDAARNRFLALLELDRRHGQLSSESSVLTRLAEVELFADNYAAAREYADAATAAARQQGDEAADPARRVRALIDAHTGLLDEAWNVAEPAATRAAERNDYVIALAWQVVLGFVAFSREDHELVDRLGIQSDDLLARTGAREPLRLGIDHLRLESLIALGRVAEAEQLLDALARRQERVPRPWLEAAIVRGRAQLLSARGKLDEAVAATNVVTTAAADGWRRFDRAQTMLVRGSLLRRLRARREAAAALDASASLFDEIGATFWAARARAESERLGRYRPGTDELTPSEQQVVELAASGLTNREVAERLSLSPKTVEAHLARSYAKLGIRSRAELGRLMATRERP